MIKKYFPEAESVQPIEGEYPWDTQPYSATYGSAAVNRAVTELRMTVLGGNEKIAQHSSGIDNIADETGGFYE